jgi:hypothetical protein
VSDIIVYWPFIHSALSIANLTTSFEVLEEFDALALQLAHRECVIARGQRVHRIRIFLCEVGQQQSVGAAISRFALLQTRELYTRQGAHKKTCICRPASRACILHLLFLLAHTICSRFTSTFCATFANKVFYICTHCGYTVAARALFYTALQHLAQMMYIICSARNE